MKKVNFNSKLQLRKEIVANLNSEQMNDVKGGATLYCFKITAKCPPRTYSFGCPPISDSCTCPDGFDIPTLTGEISGNLSH